MVFYLKINSKTKELIFKFIYFFLNAEALSFSLKSLNSYEKNKFVTVLKSPHVNKTAQEQFEYRLYSCHFIIHTNKPFLFLIFFKKILKYMFLGLNVEIKILLLLPMVVLVYLLLKFLMDINWL